MKKRAFTLLEVVIAASLSISLITVLFYFYYQTILIGGKIEEEQRKRFVFRTLEARLGAVFPKIFSKRALEKDFVFFSTSQASFMKSGTESLVFSFDNCITLDKKFSYQVIGRLFVNPAGQLILALWPSQRSWSNEELPLLHRQILLEGVEDLKFSFFVPSTLENSVIPPEVKNQWVRDWHKDYQTLPAIVRVSLVFKEKKERVNQMMFAYHLPGCPARIVFN